MAEKVTKINLEKGHIKLCKEKTCAPKKHAVFSTKLMPKSSAYQNKQRSSEKKIVCNNKQKTASPRQQKD